MFYSRYLESALEVAWGVNRLRCVSLNACDAFPGTLSTTFPPVGVRPRTVVLSVRRDTLRGAFATPSPIPNSPYGGQVTCLPQNNNSNCCNGALGSRKKRHKARNPEETSQSLSKKQQRCRGRKQGGRRGAKGYRSHGDAGKNSRQYTQRRSTSRHVMSYHVRYTLALTR